MHPACRPARLAPSAALRLARLHGGDLHLELAEAAGQPRPHAARRAAPADHRQARPSHHHLPGAGPRPRPGGQPVRIPGGHGRRDRPHGRPGPGGAAGGGRRPTVQVSARPRQSDVRRRRRRVSPSYLTSDGAVNWEPLAAYDALSDSTIALAVHGPAPAGAASLAAQLQQVNVAQALAAGEPFVAANVARLPDFAVVTATVSSRYPAAGEPLGADGDAAQRRCGLAGRLRPALELGRHVGRRAGPGRRGWLDDRGHAGCWGGRDPHLPLTAPPPVAPGAPACDLRRAAHADRDGQPEPGGGRA